MEKLRKGPSPSARRLEETVKIQPLSDGTDTVFRIQWALVILSKRRCWTRM